MSEKQQLRVGDFKRIGQPGSFAHRFSYVLPDGRELCLEACMGGYCVAMYDRFDGEIIGDKTCTNMDGFMESQIAPGYSMLSGEALEKAVKIANTML